MNNYLLFKVHVLYPEGGMNDYVDSFDSIDSMIKGIGENFSYTQLESVGEDFDFHVFNLKDNKIFKLDKDLQIIDFD